MEYSVSGLAKLAGVSARTLRYYDEIGLLKPQRVNSAGYRIYGEEQVDRLQQILFLRELGMELEKIRGIIQNPQVSRLEMLEKHMVMLQRERDRLDLLIRNADHTIKHLKGDIIMSDTEKFQGFKKEMVKENESRYGAEIRGKYGNETVDTANANMLRMTEEEYMEWKKLEQEVLNVLGAAFAEGNPAGKTAQRACELHRQWLMQCGTPYSAEYHRALGDMYAVDERFGSYYDAAGKGCAGFFRDAIDIYCTGKNQ